MEKSSNYGEARIIGSCYNFQFFTAKHGFWISVSAEVGIQGAGVWKQLHNNLQTKNFSIYLSISFLEKICDIRLFLPFLCFPIDVMIDFSDRLHNPFPKFRMKAKFLLHFYSSSYFYQWLLKHFVFFFFKFQWSVRVRTLSRRVDHSQNAATAHRGWQIVIRSKSHIPNV